MAVWSLRSAKIPRTRTSSKRKASSRTKASPAAHRADRDNPSKEASRSTKAQAVRVDRLGNRVASKVVKAASQVVKAASKVDNRASQSSSADPAKVAPSSSKAAKAALGRA